MKHYTETEIDRIVLEKDSHQDEYECLKSHIEECFSCKELYDEIVYFYYKLEQAANPSIKQANIETHNQVSIESHNIIKFSGHLQKGIRTAPQKIIDFFNSSPVKISIGFSFLIVLLVFISNLHSIFIDDNPSYFKTNDEKSALEIYNKNDNLLFSIKRSFGQHFGKLEFDSKKSFTQIQDINNDGKNEIITVLPDIQSNESNQAILRIYDYRQKQIGIKILGDSCVFDGKTYASEFSPNGLFILSSTEKKEKYILINLADKHSPYLLQKLDFSGNILGEYWHFGHFFACREIDLNNDGKKIIILTGIDDIDRQAVAVILDPEKISGKTEASLCKGFNLNSSDAEIFYIKFPTPKITVQPDARPRIMDVSKTSDSKLSFTWFDTPNSYNYAFYYYFDTDLRVCYVRSSDASRKSLQKLKVSGKVNSNSNYFENDFLIELQKGIKFWNGENWNSDWTKVNHNSSANTPSVTSSGSVSTGQH